MTRDDITRMAREAGLVKTVDCCAVPNKFCTQDQWKGDINVFAALVAAAEREACAKVLDEMVDQMTADMEPSTAIAWVRSKAAEIRARRNT